MRTNEKSANRKAFPKFLAVILIAGLIGGFLGGTAGFLGGTSLPESIVDGVYRVLELVTPWAIWVLSAVLLGGGFVCYRKARTLFAAWDGEDETVVEQAEELCSWALGGTVLNMVLSFFFFGISLVVLKNEISVTLAFILALAGIVVLQQKVVDLTRKINPEKQGSVYDMKFQKKWLASCDENEQRQIGQAAFKAFNAVNVTCAVSWGLLVVLGMVFDFGILPMFLLTLIWGVAQMVYIVESIRLGRHQ